MGTLRRYYAIIPLAVSQTDSIPSSQINVLVDDEHNARLADFGLVSALTNATSTATNITDDVGRGTPRSLTPADGFVVAQDDFRYMAPELYLDDKGARTDRSDIYALTVTIWEVCNAPFDGGM
jgi:serine/threonine protein kinase